MITRKLGRILLAAGEAITLLAVVATAAFAWSGEIQGQPTITKDSPTGYYLWHDDDGMHLRTHGPGDEHYFVARLSTDGVFEDVDAVRLENRDNFEVLDNGHVIVLRFHTYDATDGLNFRIKGGTKLHLDLRLDGKRISTDSIFIGADGDHPEHNPFTIHR